MKAYLSSSADTEFINSWETLFFPLNHTNSLTSYHLSKLFADALHFCYSYTPDCSPGEIHSNVHQLRSISLSLAQIVLAGRWSSPSVFSDFYLRSLSYFAENSTMYGLAPLVVFNANVQLPEDLWAGYPQSSSLFWWSFNLGASLAGTCVGAVSGASSFPIFAVWCSNFLHTGLIPCLGSFSR